jgi:DNA repair protein RadD
LTRWGFLISRHFKGDTMGLFDLRDYQENMIYEIETAWNSGIGSICIQLPTGAGKTRVLRTIIDNHSLSKKVIYVIAHRKNLVQQLSDELTEIELQHGIIRANAPYIKYRVQVCSMQTLVRRIDALPEPEIIICDEFHHGRSNSYMKIFNTWSAAKVLGCTATPRRPDGKSLSDITQKLIVGPEPRELIDRGYLSEFDYYAPNDVNMDGVHKRMGDFVTSESVERVDKRKVTGSAIDHYRKYSDHKPAIVACVSIEHCLHVENEFNDSGYKFKAIHSNLDDKEITRAMNGLRDGSLDGLINCDLISEGVDIPAVTTLIGLRPTNSEVIFLQQCGRVLRIAPNKDLAIILDHVGNFERHGMPDDYREWSLIGDPRSDKQKSKYKRCPSCERGNIPVSAKVCQYCGFQWTETVEAASRIPEQVEGQLVKIGNTETTIKPGEQDAIRLVARNANSLKEACEICKKLGYSGRFGFRIWTHNLKRKVTA